MQTKNLCYSIVKNASRVQLCPHSEAEKNKHDNFDFVVLISSSLEGWSLQQQTKGLTVNGCEVGFSSSESNQITSLPMLFAQYKGTCSSGQTLPH